MQGTVPGECPTTNYYSGIDISWLFRKRDTLSVKQKLRRLEDAVKSGHVKDGGKTKKSAFDYQAEYEFYKDEKRERESTRARR
jgi:hypothetical protein